MGSIRSRWTRGTAGAVIRALNRPGGLKNANNSGSNSWYSSYHSHLINCNNRVCCNCNLELR